MNNILKNIVIKTLSMFGVLYIELKINVLLLFNNNSILILSNNLLETKDIVYKYKI